MAPIKTIGMAWSSWAKQDDTPYYDKDLGYSLGDSPLASKYLFAGVAASEGEPQNDTSRRERAERCSAEIEAWESGMAHMKQASPVLWSVGLAYYLGEVPIGFRSAHKLRRRRFRVDDANGMVIARHERLSHIEGEGEMAWKRRVGRRLLMLPRTFDRHLLSFHERMSGWIEAKLPELEKV